MYKFIVISFILFTRLIAQNSISTFYPDSNLLAAEFTLNGSEIYMRHFYQYNENNFLTLEIIDDGCSEAVQDLTNVTYRHLTYATPSPSSVFPESIEERYLDPQTGEEHLLYALANEYSPEGWLINQEHYDSNHELAFTLEWEYDDEGNLIYQKDASGEETHYGYDSQGNKVFEQTGEVRQEYMYNSMNRLIQRDEIYGQKRLSAYYSYDEFGRMTKYVDIFENETDYLFDELGNKFAEIAPAIFDGSGELYRPVYTFGYDEMGRVIRETDQNGDSMCYSYNEQGQTSEIAYPDGTVGYLFYDERGYLTASQESDERVIFYTRDCLDRIVKTECYSSEGQLLYETSLNYNALQLLSETDELGNITSYSYDHFGRLQSISTERSQEIFEYDALNRIVKQTVINEGQTF